MTGNALARHMTRLIEEMGPIPLSHYMALALGHAEHGYYMTRDPLGTEGDFTTAPEISQMFGELTGLWLADQWLRQGAPERIAIAELGPGRGTLMSDLLRAIASVPDMADAAEVHFVETSPVLRAVQKARVPHAAWHERTDTLPRLPLFLVANEFFDALPVTQYQRTRRGWCERYVGLDGERFVPMLAPVPLVSDAALPAAMRKAAEGEIAEISPAGAVIAQETASHIASHGGAALIIDYGHPKSAPGDTLQAMKNHEYTDPFEAPGTADLTTHVDFETLAHAIRAGGADAHGPVGQGAFLMALGIGDRAQALSRNATAQQRQDIENARQRLTGAQEMGSLFKVLGVTPRGSALPAGFA